MPVFSVPYDGNDGGTVSTFDIWRDLKKQAEELAARGVEPSEGDYEVVVREVCREFHPPESVLAFYMAELRNMTLQRRDLRITPNESDLTA